MSELEIDRNPRLAKAREKLLRLMSIAGTIDDAEFGRAWAYALADFEVEVRADARHKAAI